MRFIRQNLATIVAGTCIAALFVASLVAFGPLGSLQAANTQSLYVVVHDCDGNAAEYALAENRRVEVATSKGRNVIAIEDGSVRMAEADCPNGTCLRQSALTAPGAQLVCLPHELWVEIVDKSGESSENSDMDFVTGQTP